jgi:hypothetical protein
VGKGSGFAKGAEIVTDERRHPDAAPFRELFHEQWKHLVRHLMETPEERAREHRQKEVVTDAIESVVSGTDARIRALGGYKKTLRDEVGALLRHLDDLANEIPPAVPFRQERFAQDPVLSRLFANVREMRRWLGASEELRAFFADPRTSGVQEAFFPLFLTKIERSVFGAALQEDRVIHDVSQTTVSFANYKVVAPAETEEQARSALKRILFGSVVEFVRLEINNRKTKAGLKTGDPQSRLDQLHAALATPRELIEIHKSMLHINQLGVLLPETEDASDKEDEVMLNEVEIGTRPSRVVLLASYPRDEMLSPEELAAEYPFYSL